MNSLNLRNLLLTSSAFVLMLFIMAFPTYLLIEIFRHEGATVFLLVIFAIGSSIYGYSTRQDNFMTTILKLSLFTSTYLLMLTTMVNYVSIFSISEKFILLISATYFAIMPLFFRNPFIRILTLTIALMLFNGTITFYFHEINLNYIFILSLIILVVLGLSNYAMGFYTLLIALSLNLLSWPLWKFFNSYYIDLSLIITIVGILIIAIGFYLQSRALHIVGLLLFGYSLFMYYYNLESSLSTKGIILISTGIVILLARYAFHFFRKNRHKN